jgi:hypothetical protein
MTNNYIWCSGKKYSPPSDTSFEMIDSNSLPFSQFQKGENLFFIFYDVIEIENKLWISYRKDFKPIGDSNLTSDKGLRKFCLFYD